MYDTYVWSHEQQTNKQTVKCKPNQTKPNQTTLSHVVWHNLAITVTTHPPTHIHRDQTSIISLQLDPFVVSFQFIPIFLS
ncbi:hypothetical protein QVD17_02651 [Tagetes erecta]|uniref:Uncharacterized protein n=1 Tax=Tagetes erecta TaxID=13708 RepID=A0AAD8L8L6_TARER|nr:hypothetical protein QVD17_02651 [Tagetes erecta]